MAEGFTKLHQSILDSTVWREADHVRLVWITMLAMADSDGVVEASIPGLADRARVPIDQCEHALERLQAPDEYSRTKDHEGRRIKPVEGGWLLVTYRKHRERMSKEDQRRKAAERQRRKRERDRNRTDPPPDGGPSRGGRDTGRDAATVTEDRDMSRLDRDGSVTSEPESREGNGRSHGSRQAEAEAEAEDPSARALADSEAQPPPEPPPEPPLDQWLVDQFEAAWRYYHPGAAPPHRYKLDPMAGWVGNAVRAIRAQSELDGNPERHNAQRLLRWWFEHEFWGEKQPDNVDKLGDNAAGAFAEMARSVA